MASASSDCFISPAATRGFRRRHADSSPAPWQTSGGIANMPPVAPVFSRLTLQAPCALGKVPSKRDHLVAYNRLICAKLIIMFNRLSFPDPRQNMPPLSQNATAFMQIRQNQRRKPSRIDTVSIESREFPAFSHTFTLLSPYSIRPFIYFVPPLLKRHQQHDSNTASSLLRPRLASASCRRLHRPLVPSIARCKQYQARHCLRLHFSPGSSRARLAAFVLSLVEPMRRSPITIGIALRTRPLRSRHENCPSL